MESQLTLHAPERPKRLRARRIPLRDGGFFLVDGEDAERIARSRWRLDSNGYPCTGSGRGRIWAHRLVMRAPRGTDVDHRDGNKLDARKRNLRFCDDSLNQANRRQVRTKTGIKGVTVHTKSRKFQAQVKCKGRNHHLGLFTDDLAAGRAYLRKARELFGEFAWSNVEQVARARRVAQAQPFQPLQRAA